VRSLLASLLFLGAAACRDYGHWDDPVADARAPIVADALAPLDAPGPGAPQVVPPIGRAGTVDILCWNVRQFPATPATPRAVADLLRSLDIDVAAVMEIDDDDAFGELLGLLPGWEGFLGGGDGYTRLALLWRPAEVTVSGLATIFAFDHDFPRPPLVATVARGGVAMTLVALHLKAGRTEADALRRQNANTKLVGWLRGRGDPRALLCGDFNEDMDNQRAPEVYGAYLAAPQTYRLLTAPLDHSGASTFLPSGAMLDHMISTAALDGALAGEAPFIPPLDRQFPRYEEIVSDHLPVALRLELR
jgi:hypothetical protein